MGTRIRGKRAWKESFVSRRKESSHWYSMLWFWRLAPSLRCLSQSKRFCSCGCDKLFFSLAIHNTNFPRCDCYEDIKVSSSFLFQRWISLLSHYTSFPFVFSVFSTLCVSWRCQRFYCSRTILHFPLLSRVDGVFVVVVPNIATHKPLCPLVGHHLVSKVEFILCQAWPVSIKRDDFQF